MLPLNVCVFVCICVCMFVYRLALSIICYACQLQQQQQKQQQKQRQRAEPLDLKAFRYFALRFSICIPCVAEQRGIQLIQNFVQQFTITFTHNIFVITNVQYGIELRFKVIL